jgi:sugar phosphate isomerase/epimerase
MSSIQMMDLSVRITTFMLITVFLAACRGERTDFIQGVQFPGLLLGFTTHNYHKILPVSEQNARLLIDLASAQGFRWIELRDPEASLSQEECGRIAGYALGKQIEVGYAISIGLLDPRFPEVFEKGLRNALLFDGPRTLRSVAFGPELADPKKPGWTAADLQRLAEVAGQSAEKAASQGIRFLLENAEEPFTGVAGQYFGYSDLIRATGNKVGIMIDVGNPFSVSRAHGRPEDLMGLLQSSPGRLGYVHLKSASEGRNLTVIGDHAPDFEALLRELEEQQVHYVAIELEAVADFEEQKRNHLESIDYLCGRGFFCRM